MLTYNQGQKPHGHLNRCRKTPLTIFNIPSQEKHEITRNKRNVPQHKKGYT
jgi:hypothetical protein